MKVKEVDKTVNVTWSPEAQHPIYLAMGTAAQQLDASFSTSATLDIYSLNLNEPGLDLKLEETVPTEHKFHKITWGAYNCNADNPQGIIIGGCDDGIIQLYNVNNVMTGNSKVEVLPKKHSGAVRALDFNNFQKHLFASGGPDSEILVWDLLHSSGPSSVPLGTKMTPSEDVVCLSWNNQVQHILASVLPSKCVIWDLRKAEPIIKVTDSSMARIKWHSVSWNPDIATQLCLASEDDQNPVVEIWDLRFATTPIKVLQGYNKGVMSVCWSPRDSELLLGCGKDDHVVCWNPNAATPEDEVVCRVQTNSHWNFNVTWCPRAPNLFAVSSYDSHMSIYSITGGHCEAETKTKIADSFPGMESYAETTGPLHQTCAQLNKPPKWLKRPAGASFAFSGKLVSFSSNSRSVSIQQITSDPGLMSRSRALEVSLEAGEYPAYCAHKLGTSPSTQGELWKFIAAGFEPEPRDSFISLLGYERGAISDEMNGLTLENGELNSEYLDDVIQINPEDELTRALLLGNIPAAVNLCAASNNFADALLLASAGTNSQLLERTRLKYFQAKMSNVGHLMRAVVSGDWTNVVKRCDRGQWAEVLVAILSQAGENDVVALCEILGKRLEEAGGELASKAELCYVASGNINRLVEAWIRTNGKSSQNIQDLVEVVLLVQKSLQCRGKVVSVCGEFAQLLSTYAEMLAAQGDLETARAYLSNSTDEKMVTLRSRIERALGVKPTRQRLVSGNYLSQTTVKRTSVSGGSMYQPPPPVINNSAAPPPTFLNNSSVAPLNPVAPAPSFLNNNAPPVVSPPSSVAPPPSFVNNSAPLPLARGASPSPGLPSRAKYVVDSSIAGGSPYASQSYSRPQSSLAQPFPPTPGSNVFQPIQSGSNQRPPSTVFGQPPSSNFHQPPSSFGPPPSNFGQDPHLNSNQGPPPGQPSYNQQAPPPVLNNFQSSNIQQQQRTFTPGWNDPPTLSAASRPDCMTAIHAGAKTFLKRHPQPYDPNSQARTQPKPMAAITQPLFTPTNQFAQGPPMASMGMLPPQQPQSTPLAPATSLFNPSPYQGGDPAHQPYYRHPQSDPVQSQTSLPPLQQATEALPTPTKRPLPEEHMHIQTVCDELRTRVYNTASNPISKKKLEDVARKLELMYDALRDSRLSPTVVQSLHHLIQCTQQGNYNGALATHTSLVSGPDFADISSFMPGLKILLQMALQCGVYL
uniref:Protein transport protein Sec31A n=1 Tax=Cacopsylla melanoneura TaxID=428564 RepID=A0A8D8QRK6_9HEMI